MQTTIHPQVLYRERLVRAVLAYRPTEVLEVGCGGGTFLRSAPLKDITLRGIDTDPDSIRKLRSEGFAVEVGAAEALPFESNSFDVVVFSYTVHHIADWPRALAEALRVSRLAVVILDPWYDERIPSQANTSAFDRWCKLIDRSNGMVHNDCLDAAAILNLRTPLTSHLSVTYEYVLILSPVEVSSFEEAAIEKLAGSKDPERWQPGLTEILNAAAQDGFSEDGAVLLSITKKNVMPCPWFEPTSKAGGSA
jgi:SAM-dependent methyltransferase